MNILYAYNKKGFEADYWEHEITAASNKNLKFLCFNYSKYLPSKHYSRAQLLDNLYFNKNSNLLNLYSDFEIALKANKIDTIIVDTFNPFHPDYLKKISQYKVLRINDGPISSYDRDFAYIHAFNKILYHSPAYSADLNIEEKLEYCGATDYNFWPNALFDRMFDPAKNSQTLFENIRDIEVIFIGSLHVEKMEFIASLKKRLKSKIMLRGQVSLKKNLYFNFLFGFPCWMRPIKFEQYVPLYQRTKIGINIHNRGKYTVGSYRLFDLPANGVMQISDGSDFIDHFYKDGDEIISYNTIDDLVDKVFYYLDDDEERIRIARNGFNRTMRDHRIKDRLLQLGSLIPQI